MALTIGTVMDRGAGTGTGRDTDRNTVRGPVRTSDHHGATGTDVGAVAPACAGG